MATGVRVQTGYDWRACALALVAGLGAAIPAGLAVTQVVGSTLFLTVVVTLVGTAVSRWVYARVARRGARTIEDEC